MNSTRQAPNGRLHNLSPTRQPVEPMAVVYQRPHSLLNLPTHYCPGCSHGAAQRLVAEVIDELMIRERTIGVWPVGCAVFGYQYFNLDGCAAAHGRAPAMATGLKRARPDRIVFTYQGDGDLASIGTNEILHAAARGEQITVFFVNNGVYGMTGGQMGPTALIGQVTSSSPGGRQPAQHGYPLRLTEMLATLPGVAFAARCSMHSGAEIRRARQAIRRAFQAQLDQQGLALVEILAACPTNWRLTPLEAQEFIRTRMVPEFPLGIFKDTRSAAPAVPPGVPEE